MRALGLCLLMAAGSSPLAQVKPRAAHARTAAVPEAAVAAFSDADWPSYGGDPGGQRYSPYKQIDKGNVASLRPVWTFHTHVFDPP